MALPPRKKLIKVGLPLEAIYRESGRENSNRHGHPTMLHVWWARRLLVQGPSAIEEAI
jgi:putative DNA methylase